MKDRNAVILANHGFTTGGKNLKHAYDIAVQVEYVSELYVKARSIGNPVILNKEEMDEVISKISVYGQGKEQE